ncbi:tRNA (cytosine(38)-C(5))-methyltransferase isoform X2 [Sander lucioperca]|uniref:tRNA (cytosine(38)-C(5))-methyltransferase isoform X2 n=1 Tax=Sander lucioperca TaxID=283035 RepID=UPI00125E899F|nr:tRNA (cytosine(38)-C(5))-methyltransferase isoform X2 [Sander lucioperca]
MEGERVPWRVLELYSGIGGMHYALKESGIPAQVVAAIDINTTANQIYGHNFPDTALWNKTIEGISLEDFNKLSIDMILMSPPCQPFTRLGLQGDVADLRTKSFLYILDLLPRLRRLPRFILLENVKGFESSSARERLVKTLVECGYTFHEIMVSPTSVGMPNSRLRYFLIAKISTENFISSKMDSVFGGLDQCSEEEKLQRLLKLKLRYFTPREVANLMGFPQSFSFPEQISTRQQYRVLGNSLNVVVVARLLQLLVS